MFNQIIIKDKKTKKMLKRYSGVPRKDSKIREVYKNAKELYPAAFKAGVWYLYIWYPVEDPQQDYFISVSYEE